jgi:hypothetical protein
MLVLIDFLENINIFGTRIYDYKLHVCHSMLLICNNFHRLATPNRSFGEIVGRSLVDLEEWPSNPIPQ